MNSSIMTYKSNTPKYHGVQEDIARRIKKQSDVPKYKKQMKSPDDYVDSSSQPTPRHQSTFSRNGAHVAGQLETSFQRKI
jgi:hypothetical protein